MLRANHRIVSEYIKSEGALQSKLERKKSKPKYYKVVWDGGINLRDDVDPNLSGNVVKVCNAGEILIGMA